MQYNHKSKTFEANMMLHLKQHGRPIETNTVPPGRFMRLALSCTYAIKCKHVCPSLLVLWGSFLDNCTGLHVRQCPSYASAFRDLHVPKDI